MSGFPTHLTPYDDAYATCDRAYASLLIYPGDHAHQHVSARLGITPTTANTKGDKLPTAFPGRLRVVPLTTWFLDSEGFVDSLDLRVHLDWLLDLLMPVKDALHELQALPGLRMRFHLLWHSATGRGGPTLWPEHLDRMAALDIGCGFDIYYFGDDDD